MARSPSRKLFLAQAMKHAELREVGCGQVAVFTAPGPGKTTPNEDGVALTELNTELAVLAVADGMGGLPAGERAAACALDALAAAVSDAHDGGRSLRDGILDGFEAANSAVREATPGGGATLAVVELAGRTMRGYHVGDSGILLVGQRGRLKHQTVAHSPVGYAVEAGVLDENEAMAHAERHVVSNALGWPDMKIDVGPVRRLARRDTLLLASDGLFDNLRVDDIIDAIRVGPLCRVADALATRTRAQMLSLAAAQPGKPDDLAFVLFRPGA